MLQKDYDSKCSPEEKEITGRVSDGAWCQDELIGGKTASCKVTVTHRNSRLLAIS
jgi:hypothetical protein